MMSKEAIQKHFDEAAEVLSSFNNATNIEAIHSVIVVMVEALQNGKKLISCGNISLTISSQNSSFAIFKKPLDKTNFFNSSKSLSDEIFDIPLIFCLIIFFKFLS